MWTRTFSKTYQNVSSDAIWNIWSDINNWHQWNPGVEYCKWDDSLVESVFVKGSAFILKPKCAPKTKIELIEVEKGKNFTDCTKFPGARMYGIHEIEDSPAGLKLTMTMRVEGWLSCLWIFLVAKKIVAKIPEQTDNLVELSKQNKC
jgi:hypothetical protein